jgi:hypothetical protein
MKKICLVMLVCTTAMNYAKVEEENVVHVEKGNFSLPTSQLPSPLFSFGQTIVDKGDLLGFFEPDYLRGTKKHFSNIGFSVGYGINDSLAMAITVPIAAKLTVCGQSSSGIEDISAELEYAFYNKDTPTYARQATILGDIFFPTGSSSKDPSTGNGSFSFFLGATFSHLDLDWYWFASSGVQLTTSHHGTKYGNEFLYQFGVGRNIAYSSKKWIFTVVVEFDGVHRQHDTIDGCVDRNSGDNIISIGPSLFFSTERLVLQGGISVPFVQDLFGIQPKDHYLIAFNIEWKFNA